MMISMSINDKADTLHRMHHWIILFNRSIEYYFYFIRARFHFLPLFISMKYSILCQLHFFWIPTCRCCFLLNVRQFYVNIKFASEKHWNMPGMGIKQIITISHYKLTVCRQRFIFVCIFCWFQLKWQVNIYLLVLRQIVLKSN